MDEQALRAALLEIFTETFQGVKPGADGTWFVEGKECLMATFDEIDAASASARPNGAASIAAHLAHTKYYLWVAASFGRGERPELDWEGSWSVQDVDQAGWAQLKRELAGAYHEVRTYMETGPLNDQDVLTGVVGNIAHAAFHLGAVRQLMKVV